MSLTVGSIETYVADSIWSEPGSYSQISAQEQVAVNLTSSTLWLVDTSKLNAETIDSPPVTLQDETVDYQTQVPFANIQATSDPIALSTGFATETSLLESSLSQDNFLQLSQVTGTIDLNSTTSATPTGSLQAGLTESTTQFTSSSTYQAATNGGSGATIAASGTATDSTTPEPTASPTSEPTSTATASSTSPSTNPTTNSATNSTTASATQSPIPNPTTSPTAAKPVPFDFSFTLGLFICIGIWIAEQMIQKRNFYQVGKSSQSR